MSNDQDARSGWYSAPELPCACAVRLEQTERALRDLQPERIALQRQREDFGGTLTEAEYARKLEALDHAVKRKTPARAVLKPTPTSS
jgi:hypothetical protein